MKAIRRLFSMNFFPLIFFCFYPLMVNASIDSDTVEESSGSDSYVEIPLETTEIQEVEAFLKGQEAGEYVELSLKEAQRMGWLKRGCTGFSYVLNCVGASGAVISGAFTVSSVIAFPTGLLLIALREPTGVPLYISMPLCYGGLGGIFAGFISTALWGSLYHCGQGLRDWLRGTSEICTEQELEAVEQE